MINEAIRAIIDLLKLKKDAKKTDLEIEKLDRERKKAQSLIEIASLDDIKKYDPKAQKVERIAKQQQRDSELFDLLRSQRTLSSRGGWFRWLLLVALVGYTLYRCAD